MVHALLALLPVHHLVLPAAPLLEVHHHPVVLLQDLLLALLDAQSPVKQTLVEADLH